MTTEQFNELINVISQLGENNYGVIDFLRDFLIPLLSTGLAAFVAFCVARYQVSKSEEQQLQQRKAEIKNQKQFMIEELKLNITEKLLESTSTVKRSINLMLELGIDNYVEIERKLYPDPKSLSKRNNNNASINQNYAGLKTYSGDLNTFTKLFDIGKDKIDIEHLDEEFEKFYRICLVDTSADSFKFPENKTSYELDSYMALVNLLDTITKHEDIVRKEQIKLIESFKETSKI